MRLPQSIIRSASIRNLHLLILGAVIALLSSVPVSAREVPPQLTSTPANLRFGTIVVGQTQTLMVTVTNNGLASVTLSGIAASDSHFTMSSLSLPMVLAGGQSFDLSVSFTPTARVWTGAAISFSSNASNSTLTLPIAGTGVNSDAVTASPSMVPFGPVATGSNSTLSVVITNDRAWSVPLLGIRTTGSGFSMSGPTVPMTLSPGQSITINVAFTPTSAGTVGGSLFVTGPMLAVPLTGTGTSSAPTPGQLTIAPAPLNFGSVPVGTTVTQPMTMNASGSSVIVSSAGSSSSQFVLNGAVFPMTIPAGQSMSFNVSFTPQGSGTTAGSLSFASNASNAQATESLTGVGTVTTYSVTLSWNSSADVVGYNVYRSANPSGTYSKINSALDANTAYTDTSVTAGQTYYYAATSVNSSGQESARSTPVPAAVP